MLGISSYFLVSGDGDGDGPVRLERQRKMTGGFDHQDHHLH